MVGTLFHVRPSKLLSMSGVTGALLRQMSMARQSASFSSFERRLFAVEVLHLLHVRPLLSADGLVGAYLAVNVATTLPDPTADESPDTSAIFPMRV